MRRVIRDPEHGASLGRLTLPDCNHRANSTKVNESKDKQNSFLLLFFGGGAGVGISNYVNFSTNRSSIVANRLIRTPLRHYMRYSDLAK